MTYYKYPKTYHLSWSKGVQNDDKLLTDYSNFFNKSIICTVKLDGENTTMYTDKIHARAIDSRNHPSRDYVKGMWGNIKHLIPQNWRICGENMYAKHSIHYTNLTAYFYVFSIWNEQNYCLSWKETLEWCILLNLTPVPVLYEGIYDEKILRNIAATLDTDKEVIKEELCVDFIFNFYNNYFNFINKPHYVYKLKVLIAGISSNNIPNLAFSDYLLDKYRGTDRCLNKERSIRYNEWLSKANDETNN